MLFGAFFLHYGVGRCFFVSLLVNTNDDIVNSLCVFVTCAIKTGKLEKWYHSCAVIKILVLVRSDLGLPPCRRLDYSNFAVDPHPFGHDPVAAPAVVCNVFAVE